MLSLGTNILFGASPPLKSSTSTCNSLITPLI
jgi:hypothetical protein